MGRWRVPIMLAASALLGVLGAAPAHAHARVAAFAPRVGHAWGIVAPGPIEIAGGVREPTVYHGGVVMHGVTLHTVFWGGPFGASPAPGVPGYAAMLQRFLGDATGGPGGVFSILSQYGDAGGPGSDVLHYDPVADSLDDGAPYPPLAKQCVSPGGAVTCVTDLQLERELDRVITATHGSRGLHDLWVMLLPASVDTCTTPSACGTNAYAGYHSLFDLGHGATVYAVIVDPAIEAPPTPGNDPQGNADAERAVDTTAHEVVEAVTDPEGTGWMDPNGGEVGDKCETFYGPPLGYAADGAPYDQVLGGHAYLVQAMWSNAASGCVMSAAPAPAPALARVSLTQFSPVLSGSIGRAGVSVQALLLRGSEPVARASARTDAHGRWRATLRIPGLGPMAVGDDRDVLEISYGPGGPAPDLIATDGGGNPFTEAGWTSWFDLDHGYGVGHHEVAVSPCGQVGVLTVRVDGAAVGSPTTACETEADVALVVTAPLGLASRLSLTSLDNRASWPRNPAGALVGMTVAMGEPFSVSSVLNRQVLLSITGFPSCTAQLRSQRVVCSGLVAGERYTLGGLRATAGADGSAAFARSDGRVWVRGGETLTLHNRAGRTMTALHIAHLRVVLRGSGDDVVGGSCEPGAYIGPPVSAPEIGPGTGGGTVAGSGQVCGPGGDARALSGRPLVQSDPFSAGETQTVVPVLATTSPAPGATLYGPFVALAQPRLPGGGDVAAQVTLAISRRGSRHVLRRLSGLQRLDGVPVSGLPRGVYTATWTVTDANGDTRTTQSPFVEEN